MWHCSVLAHLFALVLLTSRFGCVGGTEGEPSTNETKPSTPTAAERRKAAFGRIARSAATLFDTKITNRGGDGTVVKDLDRGPPLKSNLPEDEDDKPWEEDDDEADYHEYTTKLVQEEETKKKTTEAVNKAAKTPEADQHEEGTSTPAQEPERKKEPAKKKKWLAPRTHESMDRAVVKIIDSDAHPYVTVDSGGRIIWDSSEDEESSSSDDEAEDETIYLTLPNLAKFSAEEAAHKVLSSTAGFIHPMHNRLSEMFEKAKTHECRAKIAEHFGLFANALAMETKFPFEDFYYPNMCKAIPRYRDWDNLPEGVKVQDVQYRTYQPDRETVPEGTYLENANELQVLYVILTHDKPDVTIRLIESVFVPDVTRFVIHVDGKEKSDDTYNALAKYTFEKNDEAEKEGKPEYIRMVPRENCVRVNWGAFSMVDATLKALRTVFGLDYYDDHPHEKGGDQPDNPHAFMFHKLIHIASTTYPLASNTEIRNTLASHPLDANFLHIILKPNVPSTSVWGYFVECDDALHRIHRIPPLNFEKGNGIDIYTSSQWFIISNEFAWYLAKPPKGSFVEYYLDYIEHVVVADEAFFGTVIRNTHFCSTLHNDNLLHLQFDRWENEADGTRDQRKCVMRDRNHCGRSPMTLTVDYLPVLELSGDLFARKFDDIAVPEIKGHIDERRRKEEERFVREAKIIEEQKKNGTEVSLPLEEYEFQGEGVLIVAKETVEDEEPLCLGLASSGNQVMLQPCFKDDVPPTLSSDWQMGAVIIEEIEGLNRWDIGPCSSDGELKRNETGELDMFPGVYTPSGPKCMLKIGDGPRAGRCADTDSAATKPGGLLNIFPCYTRWHQLFSFGNGDIAPKGAIHTSLPSQVIKKLKPRERARNEHLCLGVIGRGDADESQWLEEEDSEDEELWPWEHEDVPVYENGRKKLGLWKGQQIQTTPCSNVGGALEWYFVPFIVEEYDEDGEVIDKGASTESDDEEL